MPYEIKKVNKGFYVCKEGANGRPTNECFSKKPHATLEKAKAQQTAIILSEIRRKK